MEVRAFEVFEDELVFGLERGLIAIGGIKKCMITPPGHFGLRPASEANATKLYCVTNVIGAKFQSDFLCVTNSKNARFLWWNWKKCRIFCKKVRKLWNLQDGIQNLHKQEEVGRLSVKCLLL